MKYKGDDCWSCQHAGDNVYDRSVVGHPKTRLKFKKCANHNIDIYEIDMACAEYKEREDLF